MDESGMVMDLLDSAEGMTDVEWHEGVLCPGFVNTHCHLELSHLKNQIPTGTGMVGFIKEVMNNKSHANEVIHEGLELAEQELINNGVVAVGDICNTADSFVMKTKKRLHYHSFIEVFSIVPQQAAGVFNKSSELHHQAEGLGLSVSISPHAPYTCSKELMRLINHFSESSGHPFTIHNQESLPEDALFRTGKGAFVDFYKELGIGLSFLHPTGKSSLEWLLPNLPLSQKTLLVHNTFTTQKEMDMAVAAHPNLYWCLCPKANLYIHDVTPAISLFVPMAERITIGTDSLASNDTLSVLEELKALHEASPSLDLEVLLQWGTLNGARYLGLDREIGTLEKGKKPGLNLLQGMDMDPLRLTKEATVQALF